MEIQVRFLRVYRHDICTPCTLYVLKLGLLDRRKIDSLAVLELAPRNNDSSTIKGYRHTAHGRDAVKPILF